MMELSIQHHIAIFTEPILKSKCTKWKKLAVWVEKIKIIKFPKETLDKNTVIAITEKNRGIIK